MAGCAEQVLARVPVQIRHRVRWGDCDPAGVVYTPRFSDYVATGFRHFLEVLLGGPLSKRLVELDLGTPAKALSFEFKRSLWPDQEFVMTIRVGDLRTRTFDLDFQAVDAEGHDIFVARLTAICVYAAVREARAIPAELRQRLEEYRLQCGAQTLI